MTITEKKIFLATATILVRVLIFISSLNDDSFALSKERQLCYSVTFYVFTVKTKTLYQYEFRISDK